VKLLQEAVRSDCYHNVETNAEKVFKLVVEVAPCLVADIKRKRLEWLGHVIKIEQWQQNSFFEVRQKVDEKWEIRCRE
jgi:hypothetical protein